MSYSQNRNALMAQKPEYVLKRANDLINSAIGNNADREKRGALEQLHAHISSRGKKTQSSSWSKVYEQLMKRHLELCVDLKDDRTAKDGLHQYRNLCQSVDPASLELVVVHLMDLAEAKALAARTKANKVALAAAAKISDLDQEETPESIMLSSMTEEGHRDRTDREVVVPWLKFLWEIYRATLDLLHKNAKLERVYHKTCEKAFAFCKGFGRTLEFRRLCEMLRLHLASLQKTAIPMAPIPGRAMRQPWEWTPESIELHLQTRFAQLEVASSLELWNEGFRTVEDIYAIMQIGTKKSKPKVMVAYYEKLTRIFLVSDNHLFHAYCWFRYYTLTVDSKKDLAPADKRNMASAVLLSALCIPSIKESGITNTIPVILDDEEIAHEKNQRMALLLDFQANPTRHALLQDIVARGILNEVIPGLAELYSTLESKFNPLTLASQIADSIALVKSTASLAHYAVPLQRVAVLRVVLQLSRVYSSVKVDFVRKLLAPLTDVPYNQVERVMVDGVSRKQLQLRIDHAAGCLRFGSLVTASTVIETQVASFGSALAKLADASVAITAGASVEKSRTSERQAFIAKVAAGVEAERAALVERKRIIELRKEGLERQHAIAAERTRISVEEQEAKRKVAENKRLEEEARQREEDNKRKSEEKLTIMKFQKELTRFSIVMDDAEIAAMNAEARLAVLRDAKAKEQASKDEAGRRVNEQAKKLDHITRALRIEARDIIGQKYTEQVERDRVAHEQAWKAAEAQRREQHAQELVEKARFARMHAHRASFEGPQLAQQKDAYERFEAKKLEKALLEIRQKRVARARQRLNDEVEREKEEREMEQDRLEKDRIEKDRLDFENHERLRLQREADEAAERAIAAEAERIKREEERAARLASAGASASTSGGDGGGRWQSSSTRGEGAPPAGGGSGLARFAAAAGAGGPERAPGSGWGSGPRGEAASKDGPPSEGRWGNRGGGDRPSGGFGDRPERREGGGGFGDRPERREGGGGFGDRSERREGGGGFGERREGGGGFGDRSERREGGGGFGERREGGGGFGDRSERREGGGDRPSGGFGDRSERREGGGGFGDRREGGRGEGGGFGGPRRDEGARGPPRAPGAADESSSWRKK